MDTGMTTAVRGEFRGHVYDSILETIGATPVPVRVVVWLEVRFWPLEEPLDNVSTTSADDEPTTVGL